MMLRNPLYVGRLRWNKITAGKFHKLAGGKAVKKALGVKARGRNPDGEWVVKEAACPALVSHELFDAVARRLSAGRPGKGRSITPLVEGGGFVLSGLLRCGHCGAPMCGRTDGSGLGARRIYRCSRYVERGRASGCPGGLIHEKAMLRVVARQLQRHLGRDELVEQLRAEARRQAAADQSPARRRELDKLTAKLAGKVDDKSRRLLILPDDVLDGAVKEVRELKAQLAAARSELDGLGASDPVGDTEAVIRALRERLSGLREILTEGDPRDVRIVLRDVVGRVTVWSEPDPGRSGGKNVLTRLARGEIELSSNLPGMV
jgi:hypothetical protein